MTNKQNIKILVFHLSPIKDEMVKIENWEMESFLPQKNLLCPLVRTRWGHSQRQMICHIGGIPKCRKNLLSVYLKDFFYILKWFPRTQRPDNSGHIDWRAWHTRFSVTNLWTHWNAGKHVHFWVLIFKQTRGLIKSQVAYSHAYQESAHSQTLGGNWRS